MLCLEKVKILGYGGIRGKEIDEGFRLFGTRMQIQRSQEGYVSWIFHYLENDSYRLIDVDFDLDFVIYNPGPRCVSYLLIIFLIVMIRFLHHDKSSPLWPLHPLPIASLVGSDRLKQLDTDIHHPKPRIGHQFPHEQPRLESTYTYTS